ncbi:MAG: hypothetical protein KME16_21920 [Scytolyngbya sp. HA4215-MV1]|nr:hypothetical protein [Scytolyngbya sp. HA4215-MV1]
MNLCDRLCFILRLATGSRFSSLCLTLEKSVTTTISILDEIERELSQWYGDRRLVV